MAANDPCSDTDSCHDRPGKAANHRFLMKKNAVRRQPFCPRRPAYARAASMRSICREMGGRSARQPRVFLSTFASPGLISLRTLPPNCCFDPIHTGIGWRLTDFGSKIIIFPISCQLRISDEFEGRVWLRSPLESDERICGRLLIEP